MKDFKTVNLKDENTNTGGVAMKQKYTKPAFAVERFDLAQSIAAGGCSANDPANPYASIGDPNWGNANECGWRVGDYVIWTAENCGDSMFSIVAGPDDEVLGFCYNNPSGNNVIFMS